MINSNNELVDKVFESSLFNSLSLQNWFQLIQAEQKDNGQIDSLAKEILEKLPAENKTNHLRYKFQDACNKNQLLQTIFDRSFRLDPEGICQAAEKKVGRHFFPRWKRVACIQLPRIIAVNLNSPIIKVAFSALLLIASYKFISATYTFSKHLTEQTINPFLLGRVVPCVVNHTPLALVELANRVIDCFEIVRQYRLRIVGTIILMRVLTKAFPRLPYLQKFDNLGSHLFDIIFINPQRTGSFFITFALDSAKLGWKVCSAGAEKSEQMAEIFERRRLFICQQQAKDVWMQSFV